MLAKVARWTSAAVLVLCATACDNTAKGLKRDAGENQRKAAELSADAQEKAEVAAEKASEAADAAARAARAAGDAVATSGRAAEAATHTLEVKSALIADQRVEAGGIDVDSDSTTKTITLKGHVPNPAQKRIAEEIATAHAGGYHVTNELMVRK
jgi:osmotically-inducible protein OsmY